MATMVNGGYPCANHPKVAFLILRDRDNSGCPLQVRGFPLVLLSLVELNLHKCVPRMESLAEQACATLQLSALANLSESLSAQRNSFSFRPND